MKKLIEVGRYGITRTQMLRAINNVFNIGKLEKLEILYNEYPEIFISTIRYLKSEQRYYIKNNINIGFNFKGNVKPGKYGVTKTQILNSLKYNINNKNNIIDIFNEFPSLVKNSIRYLKKDEKKLVMSYIYDLEFKDEYKHKNNDKLINLIKSNYSIINSLSKLEYTLVKDVINDLSINEIAKKNNLTKDKVYNILFGNNGKSILARVC